MKLVSLVLFSAFFATTALAAPTTWEVDGAHTNVGFSVKHMVVTNAKGQFKTFTGTIVWDDKDLTKSTINVNIDAKSIDTNQPKRDEHLRSPDFFDVAKYPALTFKSTKVEKAKDGKLKVTGDLTIRDVTKSVVLTVEGPTAPIKSPFGNQVSSFHASGAINRKDFGLSWNKTLESGGLLVGEEVKLDLDGELNQKN
jgi:polyisoprenoid-binding protein YceI